MSATAQVAWGPTVLLVEDEESIAGLLRSYLTAQGFRIVWVRSGEEALAELDRHPIRVVLLDLGLPGMDGFDVCRQIRYRSKVPLVMVTARDEEIDRVAGLEIGADDYVVKPFSAKEVLARVAAVLRRSAERPRAVGRIDLNGCTVDFERREVTSKGRKPAALSEREADVLRYLASSDGRVVSRDELLQRVWGLDPKGVTTRTVDMHVASLRRKLDRPELVQTVRGVGYKARGR